MGRRKNCGITLILVSAVLSILAAMATGFYVLMLMQTKSATHYTDSMRAEMAARAGVNYGVAMLRSQAFQRTEDPTNAWYGADYLHGASKRISFPDSPLLHDGADDDKDGVIDNPEEALLDRTKQQGYSVALNNSAGNPLSPQSPQCPDPTAEPQYQPPSDRFTLNVSDAAGKININAGDNLGVILDNLCRVIGPPLVAASPDALQPRRWAVEAPDDADVQKAYASTLNQNDTVKNFTAANLDIYYALTDVSGNPPPAPPAKPNSPLRPIRDKATGKAIYGDGYAIAGYRARNGAFRNLADVKNALTYVERSNPANGRPDDALEQLEIEVKFAAIRDYITINSWVDTNTVCVGKFEWVHIDTTAGKTYAIDRDKSWVIDDLVNDPFNLRGSLRGCYLSIINGHGAGQLRRIRSNGIDWLEVDNGFAVTPGPISSYMIVSNEEAMLADAQNGSTTYSYVPLPPKNPTPPTLPPAGTLTFPMTNKDGTLVRNTNMDYSQHPLCIHRAPVNVNTASDKVLVALLLGINVQHGHPLALGTDADVELTRQKWKVIDPVTHQDPHGVQPFVLTPAGLKRIPQSSGKPVLNRLWKNDPKQVVPPPVVYDVAYLDNYGSLGAPNFDPNVKDQWPKPSVIGTMTEAHELAYRILMARQTDRAQPTLKYLDVPTSTNTTNTGNPTATNTGVLRGPFTTYDDLYFRAIKPWDDMRFKNGWVDTNGNLYPDGGDVFHKARLAPMLMANFNSNTDILKFNPNIEWIDRWGRNFTEQEPLMIYTDSSPPANGIFTEDVPAADPVSGSSIPIYTAVVDPNSRGWAGGTAPPIKSAQKDSSGNFILGAYITRNFRYKSDEMIDKSDLNRSTTEFSFDSNGIFEIVSTGQVVKNGAVLAERKFAALVKVYDVWRESTQQQFVQGMLSKAYGDQKTTRGTTYSGQLARDASASGLVERKGLVTLPEPLLPLAARIVDQNGNPNPKNQELVSSVGTGNNEPLDAFSSLGTAKNVRQNPYTGEKGIAVPEVLANHVLPARYDGQIALATNTSGYDPSTTGDEDTFLATFDGDLDTATCLGNGREQAKWPCAATFDSGNPTYTGEGYKYRCVQCIGLLGVLNDTLVVTDPGLPLIDGKSPFLNWAADKARVRWVYPFFGISAALMPLKLGPDPERPSYWNNVILRMGSLRTDGVYISAPGVAGTNATLKYLFTPDKTDRHKKLNFQPDSPDGNIVSMWAKPVWHGNDMRNHEFFNPGNPHMATWCGGYFFQKLGQYKWTSVDASSGLDICGNRNELNDLFAMAGHDMSNGAPGFITDQWIYGTFLHGGYAWVDAKKCPKEESPGFRIQPFRWSFLGYRSNFGSQSIDAEAIGPRGHWLPTGQGDFQNAKNMNMALHYVRAFIDTALYPEGQKTWTPNLFWSYRTNTPGSGSTYSSTGDPRDVEGRDTSVTHPDPYHNAITEGQDVKYVWADPYAKIAPDPDKTDSSLKSFGMNNLNYGNPAYKDPFDPTGSYNNDPLNTGRPAAIGSCALYWHWRNMPEDGTYAVIDELKISNKDTVLRDSVAATPTGDPPSGNAFPLPGGGGYQQADYSKDRVVREMQTSRYYLPPSPSTRTVVPSAGGPPTFTSQTLLQSLKGFDQTKNGQNVAVVRVSWNVFTPRFMCEYKSVLISPFTRTENLTFDATNQQQIQFPFKGPFDYIKYNSDKYNDNPPIPTDRYYSVSRPSPSDYLKYGNNQPGWAQSGRGVEIELLKDAGEGATPLDNKTFTDPTAINSLGTPAKPVWVHSHQLRYRVRFCYPVDPLVDPTGGKKTDGKPYVDPANQYLLDTPVFDDISITYIVPTRILDFHEVTE